MGRMLEKNGLDTTNRSINSIIHTGAPAVCVDERLLGVYHAFWRRRDFLDHSDIGADDTEKDEKGRYRGGMFTDTWFFDHKCDIEAAGGPCAAV